MPAEQEDAAQDERPKTWNSSTKLTQPRPKATATRTRQAGGASRRERTGPVRSERRDRQPRSVGLRDDHSENEQQTLTRELLERAVSTVFGGLMQDSTLDATAFPDVHESQSSELSSVRDKEYTPPVVVNPATKIESNLRSTVEAGKLLSVNHRQRRREHAQVLQQATEDTRATREFQRRMKHAAFEHRERKIAVQSLQAQIQREIQFLAATAADLEKREFLLDDAFESYERALRLELGLDDSACSLSKQKQVEASPRRFY